LFIGHGRVSEKFSPKVAFQLSKDLKNRSEHMSIRLEDNLLHQLCNLQSSLQGSPGIQGKHGQVSGHSDAGGDDFRLSRSRQHCRDFARVQIRDMLVLIDLKPLVVAFDNRIKDFLEGTYTASSCVLELFERPT